MIPIKIRCGCGQRYAFDAEPVDGALPAVVNCPACGADGTATANAIIAETLAAAPATPPAKGTRLRVALAEPAAPSSPPPAPSLPVGAADAMRLGLVDRQQAQVEARAKVSWGEPPEKVLQYLMIQGFKHQEAADLMTVLYQERSKQVRARGMKKILIGSGLIVAAAAGILYMFAVKFVVPKLVGVLFAVAVWGLWLLVNGAIMVAAPKMQSGDVAES